MDIIYLCYNCHKECIIVDKSQLVCKYCGSRIFYKKRIDKPITYKAM